MEERALVRFRSGLQEHPSKITLQFKLDNVFFSHLITGMGSTVFFVLKTHIETETSDKLRNTFQNFKARKPLPYNILSFKTSDPLNF